MFSLFKKKAFKLVDVKRGMHLEAAEESTVQEFFQKRMENRIKKVLGYNWEIIFRTDEWLYFAYPKGHKKPKQYIEKLYKVKRTTLEKEFPGFAAITGQQLRKAVGQTLQKKFPLGNYTTMMQDIQWQAKLLEATILVEVQWSFSTDSNPKTRKSLQLVLDKTHLTFIALEEKS